MNGEVSLKEFVEAILDEQRRGMLVAEQEREKSARALRAELERSIKEGDTNLREHIAAQVMQIREALFSQEKLDVQRHATGDLKTESVQREMKLINDASTEAVQKAETATEKRFESVNEFRQSLSDQTAEFIRREVFDAKLNEIQRSLQALMDEVNVSRGRGSGINAATGAMVAAATLLLGIIVVVANILAGG